MTEEKIDRGGSLKRSAELRAAIIAGMGSMENYKMGLIGELDLVKQLSVKPKDIQNAVYRMVKMGLLEQQGSGAASEYRLKAGTALSVAKKPIAAKGNPTIQVDVIKSTGRVRLTLGGLIIEVGVSNE